MKNMARRISNRGKNRVIGKFISLKMNRTVMWESQIERDYCYWLEFDQDVISFRSQPLTINYIFEDQILTYTPDFEVCRYSLPDNQYQYIEVKPNQKSIEEDFKRKHIARAAYFYNHGHKYDLITDKMLRIGNYLENIKILYRYSRLRVDAEVIYELKLLLPTYSKITLEVLQNQCISLKQPKELAYFLLYNKLAYFDMNIPLYADTELELRWCNGGKL